MSWKLQLEKFESNKEWQSAVDLVKETVDKNKDDIDIYIRGIYLIHNILVEEDYPNEEQDNLSVMLQNYFNMSYEKFSENAEYLFFIGKILYIGEWFFGLDDDVKPMEQRLAFQMQRKALEKEPENPLYEWAYKLSDLDKKRILYACRRKRRLRKA